MLTLSIDLLPLSVNASLMSGRGGGRLIHTSEARHFKEVALLSTAMGLEAAIKDNQDVLAEILSYTGRELKATIIYQSDIWYTASNSIRKKDCDNLSKLYIDSVFSALQVYNPSLDDSQLFSILLQKSYIPSCSDKTTLFLEIL